MRKLILISAFVLASVSAQAGQSRSLILASSDQPKATIETVKPVQTAPATSRATPATTATAAAASTDTATTATAAPAPASASTTATTTTESTKPARKHASQSAKKTRKHGWEADEAKARRIAARYGVYW